MMDKVRRRVRRVSMAGKTRRREGVQAAQFSRLMYFTTTGKCNYGTTMMHCQIHVLLNVDEKEKIKKSKCFLFPLEYI